MIPTTRLASFAAATVLAVLSSCSDESSASSPGSGGTAREAGGDAPAVATASAVAVTQQRLLDLAFEAVSKFPLDPHIKNRSRAQETVAIAWLDLDRPEQALRCIERIANWRRGTGYADVAIHLLRNGVVDGVRGHLRRATEVADQHGERDVDQEWRRDRISARVALAQTLLEELEATVGKSVTGLEPGYDSEVSDESRRFDARLEELRTVFESGSFDNQRAALDEYVDLFDRYYADRERRARLIDQAKTGYEKLPPMARIETLEALVKHAIAHGDEVQAGALLDDAQSAVKAFTWRPEDEIPLLGRLAGHRARAGDAVNARREAYVALGSFEVGRSEMADIYHADALRPIAEAFELMGERALATSTYRRAVEAGVHNPNSRPRANDLCATCVSMARVSFQPDAELFARLTRIASDLGDPW